MLTSCSQNKLSRSYNKQMKESYIYNFKIIYFKKSLIQGFNNTEEVRNFISKDNSGFSENILTLEDYHIVDSFIKIDNYIMIKDSIGSIGRVAEGAEGKQVFTNALYKFNSKWLDSLAKARWKLSKDNY